MLTSYGRISINNRRKADSMSNSNMKIKKIPLDSNAVQLEVVQEL